MRCVQTHGDGSLRIRMDTKNNKDIIASMEPELVETITEVFKKITYTVAEDNKDIIIVKEFKK